MKKIKTYEEFTNEEINLKNALIGTAIGTAALGSVYNTIVNSDKAKLSDTEIVSGNKFKQYDLLAAGQSFDLNVSEDGIITSIWSTTEHDTDSEGNDETTTTSHTCITIPNSSINEIWYESTFLNGVFASSKPLSGGHKIKISDLDKEKETDTYIIYSGKFLSPFDYIVVNKNHTEGEEYVVSDDKLHATYVCDNIAPDIYLFGVKKMGGGAYGGGGSGSNY
jgi:hypothetical protein